MTPAIDLVRNAYSAAEVKDDLEGFATTISINKTRQAFGRQPKLT
ncbi:MAG: hypothetical protein OTJ98_08030 [Dehalococcoidia bacterium]|nr:hypothetical protein [Dehalococcoidia bacterium]